jgi:hypothetical protein
MTGHRAELMSTPARNAMAIAVLQTDARNAIAQVTAARAELAAIPAGADMAHRAPIEHRFREAVDQAARLANSARPPAATAMVRVPVKGEPGETVLAPITFACSLYAANKPVEFDPGPQIDTEPNEADLAAMAAEGEA